MNGWQCKELWLSKFEKEKRESINEYDPCGEVLDGIVAQRNLQLFTISVPILKLQMPLTSSKNITYIPKN